MVGRVQPLPEIVAAVERVHDLEVALALLDLGAHPAQPPQALFVLHPLSDAENLNLRELAKRQGIHPVDVMLDIAVADDLKTEFYTTIGCSLPYLAEIVGSVLAILGVSDGGAHTKIFTAGR